MVAPIPGAARSVRERLESTLTPLEALRTLRSDAHPFALSGTWLGGGAILGSEPLHVVAGPGGADPFDTLDARTALEASADVGAMPHVGGGWVGYLGYRAGHLVEDLPHGPSRPRPLPDWWLAWHDHVIRFDPDSGWWFEALWTEERAEALAARRMLLAERLASASPPPHPVGCSEFVATPGPAAHRAAVRRTIDLIEAGDIYQANVCRRLDATLEGDALDLFVAGASVLDPPYAAFLDLGHGRAVVSLSPEQFLRREHDRVTTRPIKGTRRRSGDADADASARAELLASAKERAENVMIVDLMRNDLGRVCIPGSVEVPELFTIEAHPGLWHLASEVTGRLRPDVGDGGLLRAAFPPGSVTGAPKVRSMEVISEVEATGREVYTGCIGMASPVAGAEWNVGIRSFEVDGPAVWLGVGGGIVAESDPQAELDECRAKAAPLIEAIGARMADEPVADTTGAPPTNVGA
ncbi:MAG: aminodeoxychorismate synthase component I [Acidimicrobiia bacterium]|nr:aminodeoxychorismate synthase component I [Acidimicrobiia bacterium]